MGTVTDTFVRGDQLGWDSGWEISGQNDLYSIFQNHGETQQAGGGSHSCARWISDNFDPNNQSSFFFINKAVDSSGGFGYVRAGPAVCCQNPTSSAIGGYCGMWDKIAATTTIRKFSLPNTQYGSETILTSIAIVTLNDGDTVELDFNAALDPNLTLKRNGGIILTFNDASPITGGAPGLIYGNYGGAAVNGWEIGDGVQGWTGTDTVVP